MPRINPILNTDGYKPSHWLQHPPGMTHSFCYLESRGGLFHRTLFFGLQAILKEALLDPITLGDILEAKDFFDHYGVPFNEAGWMRLLQKHDGFLPLEIRAVAEGSIVPTSNALMTVVNTDPEFFWLPGHVETLLMRLWYPITVATLSQHIRETILQFLKLTAEDPENEILFKLHDFGARGVSSYDSAVLGGMAHLVNFRGSDTIAAAIGLRDYYGQNFGWARSIPAAEHSTITSWGRENEIDAYRNMLERFAHPGAAVAIVSDSYDLYGAIENIWGGALRQQVVESGAAVIIRPDSGDPEEVVSRTLKLLADKFGTEENSKGYKLLRNVRVIQGDGVDHETIRKILNRMISEGFSASNISFGMGGALLQKVDRDTLKFAYKCSAAKVDGAWRDVYKDPVTDKGKRSKCGLLGLERLEKDAPYYRTVPLDPETMTSANCDNLLEIVFQNGKLLRDDSFAQIVARAAE